MEDHEAEDITNPKVNRDRFSLGAFIEKATSDDIFMA